MTSPVAFLFDLDGTLVDSVYNHVRAWHLALSQNGIVLSVWRIHRRIEMSGGLFAIASPDLAQGKVLRRSPETTVESRRNCAWCASARLRATGSLDQVHEIPRCIAICLALKRDIQISSRSQRMQQCPKGEPLTAL